MSQFELEVLVIKRAILVKEQVSEAVVRRLQIRFLKHFVNPTGNHLCWRFFSIKFACLKVCNSIKKRLQHRCLPAKFAKYAGNFFLQNTNGRLLLVIVVSIVVKGELAN